MTLTVDGRPIDVVDVTSPVKRVMDMCEGNVWTRMAVFSVAHELADEFGLTDAKRECFLKDCGAVPRIKKEN